MTKEELINNCCKVTKNGWQFAVFPQGEWLIITPNSEKVVLDDRFPPGKYINDWIKSYYPLLLCQACDELGISIYNSGEDVWCYDFMCIDRGLVKGIQFESPQEAREEAIGAYFDKEQEKC